MLPSLTKFYIPTQLMVALSWLAFFVPPEVISGRMVLLVILLLMLTNVGKGSLSRVYPPKQIYYSIYSRYRALNPLSNGHTS